MQEENFDEFEDNYEDDFMDESIIQLVKSAAKSADKLTALIVENNRHNSQKMGTEDIYKTYVDSFSIALRTILPGTEE
jgi:hypothetical protein